ncbi:hypothetical protein JCM10207_007642 [Rhodosporidiobolus poonsookiae]
MATATPTRRSSYAPSTISDLASPPSFSRRASAVSSTTGGSPSIGGTPHSERKRRNRTLLRDYYGLGQAKPAQEQLDIDSPQSFSPDAYFTQLTSTASLPDLLKRENELLNEICELDGERQSLVYNHHYELIGASDTIRKMKSRAEALDTSLDSLKASFQSISQLSASLSSTTSSSSASAAPSSPNPPQTPTRSRPSIRIDTPDTPSNEADATPTRAQHRSSSSIAAVSLLPSAPSSSSTFSPLTHLPALLSLPTLLRALLAADARAQADSLWGAWEPALRSWEDEGVEGAREVGMECRDVLRAGRRASVSERRGEVEGLAQGA